MASSFCEALRVWAVARWGGVLSVYSPRPRESTATARRAKEDDFTARNFATIAPAAQDRPRVPANWPEACCPAPSVLRTRRARNVEIERALLLCYGLAEFLLQLGTRMLRTLK